MSDHDRNSHGAPPDGADMNAAESVPAHTISRREAVGLLAALPLAGALELTPPALERALRAADDARAAREAGGAAPAPKFFTAHEWRTVRLLVDDVIPRDATSGGATDAGVPEFMDFIMGDKPNNQIWMRGGLAWLDLECQRRHGTTFVASAPAHRTEVLDAIAFPDKAAPEMRAGVAFFNRFRDMTASGFYTTKIGIADVQYMGNKMRTGWDGCPD
ncbi:MAG TPA: gluconate 2-dehydrogenase subunit 3 family protein, partial [Gemmatimonadaceae bacterium]|nr:gluconate 2-dehydrogenase subunit 3 family protein [Gemmatimonadaceae bacterium]